MAATEIPPSRHSLSSAGLMLLFSLAKSAAMNGHEQGRWFGTLSPPKVKQVPFVRAVMDVAFCWRRHVGPPRAGTFAAGILRPEPRNARKEQDQPSNRTDVAHCEVNPKAKRWGARGANCLGSLNPWGQKGFRTRRFGELKAAVIMAAQAAGGTQLSCRTVPKPGRGAFPANNHKPFIY
jgi:hypothetical protein